MNCIKFTISGDTAFFKNPDFNNNGSDMFYTFPHIHKIAIMGILGAAIGLNGYRKQNNLSNKEKTDYPEFYEKLCNLKIAIVPKKEVFKSCFVYQTNTVGYANIGKKVPATLTWNEKWLQDVSWNIYILDDESDIFNRIKYSIKNEDYKYHLYLGQNHHFCYISNYEELELKDKNGNSYKSIISIPKNESSNFSNIELGRIRQIPGNNITKKTIFFYAPVEIDKETNHYVYYENWLTNQPVLSNFDNSKIYNDGDGNLFFV